MPRAWGLSCQASTLMSIRGPAHPTQPRDSLDLGISRMGAPGARPGVGLPSGAQCGAPSSELSFTCVFLCLPFRQPRGAGAQRRRQTLPRACAGATWLAVVLGELVCLGCICCAVIGLLPLSSLPRGGAGLCSFQEKLERASSEGWGMHAGRSKSGEQQRASARDWSRLPHLAGHAPFAGPSLPVCTGLCFWTSPCTLRLLAWGG